LQIAVVRKFLDRLYLASGVLAAFGICVIGTLTLMQIVARLLGTFVPSAGDFAGFAMGASAFLGLAYTLRHGGHIRVNLITNKLPKRVQWIVEVVSLVIAVLIVGYYAYYSSWLLWKTVEFGEFTLGLVSIPKWIPMVAMPVGVVILFIAFVEELARVLMGREPSYAAAEESETEAPTKIM
jgi:TRAP-type C4-dicarboxylate transport system permease small subunit